MEPAKLTDIYESLKPLLHERSRRLFAGLLAQAMGRGGIAFVSRATGLARSGIGRGLAELAAIAAAGGVPGNHVRRPGGGRKRAVEHDPTLLEDLRRLVDPATRGDPESPLLWVSKSIEHLTAALRDQGHRVGRETVRLLLKELDFSLQANRKTREGKQHRDRDAQFECIAQLAKDFLAAQQPVISVDTKKKELVGDFRNGGREWQPEGEPEAVRMHDFPDPKLGKAIPYGVYDVHANEGWVSVGIDHDTAAFAATTIQRWWERMGAVRYPDARYLMITGDCGGSNSNTNRLWKTSLQAFADQSGLTLFVSHLPPGTSKWNKIEHRMFNRITENWRGRPLISLEVVVNLIAGAHTKTGLRIQAELGFCRRPSGQPGMKQLIPAET